MNEPQIATLTEIENSWSYTDMVKANALLDMRSDYERYMRSIEDE